MGLSRSGTLFLIGLLVLIGVSLHPVAGVEAVVDRLFAPARILGELALPFRFLGVSSVRAAQAENETASAAERERSRAVLLASQAAAMPVDAALQRDRALVGAHVIGRPERNRDRLRLRFNVDAGVGAGMPVVCGDVFVGRVAELDPRHPGECLADLVTLRNFRVGAVVEQELGATSAPARFIVGGILEDTRGKHPTLHLAAQFPSDHAVRAGDLRVSEEASSPDERLADGFRLGRLEPVELRGFGSTRLDPLGVRPLIDYESGLNALAIVCPPQMSTAGPVLAVDPFDPAAWIDARILLAGDVSPLRATRKLALGSSSGVRAGSAVAIGARFVGRVDRVGAWSCDARLLADPGTSFHALARTSAAEAPVILGKVVSCGCDSAGDVRLEWQAAIGISGAEGTRVSAEVWTAAGEPDVPPGLLVGTTELPCGSGPFRLAVHPAQDARSILRVRVWRGRASSGDLP